jgi:DNA repair protein SbcC/Rad50
MRPLHLSVDGFTSFRAPVDLDFASLDLFAITGPTGAGKSSLIDALTFALYGQVPRVGREYKQLMSHGAERLSVRLDFRMGAETYRIARTLKSSGAPQSRLERLSAKGPLPVADRVKDIEDEVGRILGLDYDGFTRSVVLPQGQFDAFLTGKPEERRKILVTLLGLDVYERMHALVNRKAADARREAQFLVQQLERDFAEATPAMLEQLRAELQAAEASAGDAGDEEAALAAALKTAVTLRTARRELAELEKEAATEAVRLKQAEQALAKARERRAEIERRRQGLHWRSEAALGDPARDAVLAQARTWADELARVAREIDRLEPQLGACADALRRAEAEAEGVQARLQGAESTRGAAEIAAREAREALEERRRELAAHDLQRHLEAGSACPVCEQEVAKVPKHRKPTGLEAAEAQARAAETEIEKARQLVESSRLKREQLAGRVGAAEVERRSLDERCEEARQSRRRLSESLEGAGFLPLAIAEPAALIERIAAEAKAALRAREERDRLEDERRQLDQEATKLAAEEATAEAQREAAVGRASEIGEKQAPLAELFEEARAVLESDARARGWRLTGAADEMAALESCQAALRAEAQERRGRVERLRTRLEALERAVARAVELAARRQGLESESTLAAALAQNLRADQFLAFVQEEALERLAADGSRHLLTLSQGRYALFCEDQEFVVQDHWHADRQRSVRTLSGGETFLASLALAMALAEGLAALSAEGRAGEALESLFLDEGFGTLDPETLDVVVQAIETLQGGRRLVGVITHIAELAQRLPARVEVGRSASGATLTLR